MLDTARAPGLHAFALARRLRSLLRRLASGLERLWAAACRHAEREDRVVPYY